MRNLTKSILASLLLLVFVSACSDDNEDTWKKYADWRELNASWLAEQEALTVDGQKFYQKITPNYDKGNYVLIHWFNDREATKDNPQPFYTSTVDVKYIGRLYNDEAFDSSYTNTANGDSIFRTKVNGVIAAWTAALQEMHVGDSVQIIAPYQSAYGASSSGIIKPYSNLVFNIKLVGIPYWEAKP